MEDSQPNYAQFKLGAGNREFRFPPTTHLVATVEDLTNLLDYTFEDFEGMDLEAEADLDQNWPVTGRWTTTSSYDVYVVDTPKEKEGDSENDPVKDKPVEEPPKRWCPKHRTKSRKGKDSNTVTNDSDSTEQAEDPADPAIEQEEREDGE